MAIKEDVERGGNNVQEEIREQLLQLASEEENGPGDEYQPHKRSKEQLGMVYLCTFIAVCGSFQFGSCTGYSSPTQSAIMEDINLSLAEFSMFSSMLSFGAMIGAITSGSIADFIGRKGAMGISSIFCIAGWLVIYFAKGALALDIGRIATGIGIGIFTYVVPIFIAEISPKNRRGLLTSINEIVIAIGICFVYTIGTVITWRALALTGLLPCGVMLLGLFIIPESPRWLAEMGRQKDFEVSLQRLRGKDADIAKEASEIQDYIETLHRLPKAKILDMFQKRYLQSVIIGNGLIVFQQFGGITGICFYVSEIFEQAGVSSSLGSISYASIQVVANIISASIMDKAGRKPLLLVSASGMVVGCVLTGISFYLKDHESKSEPMLALIGIMIYSATYASGMGAIPSLIMSEIFPINIKGVAGSVATLVNCFGAWMVSYTFNYLMTWSSYGTFLLYAAINALAVLFVVKMVPETKGKTLEQIQAAINSSFSKV